MNIWTDWESVPTFLIYGELKFAATYLINKGSALLFAMTEGVVCLNADTMSPFVHMVFL